MDRKRPLEGDPDFHRKGVSRQRFNDGSPAQIRPAFQQHPTPMSPFMGGMPPPHGLVRLPPPHPLVYDIPFVKDWLMKQPDSFTLEDICELYPEFKSREVKILLAKVFDFYKEQLWFKELYHPTLCVDPFIGRQNAITTSRLAAFLECDDGTLDDVELEGKHNIKKVAKLLRKVNGILDPDTRDESEKENTESADDAEKPKSSSSEVQNNGGGGGGGVVSTDKDAGEVDDEFPKREAGDEELELDFGEEEQAGEGNKELLEAGEVEAEEETGPQAADYITFQSRNFPANLSSESLVAALKEIPGFVRCAITYPSDSVRPIERKAVVCYYKKNVDQMRKTLRQVRIGNYGLHFYTVRSVPFVHVSADETVRRHATDTELITDLIRMFDKKYGLWEESQNPILDVDVQDDKRILYLRIVYSFDFYSGKEEQWENNMPSRVGDITIRKDGEELKGPRPPRAGFRANCKARLEAETFPSNDIIKEIRRDEEDEVAEMIRRSTKPMKHADQDVYQCTLSGKLFKTPDFVEKHIYSKHQDKIDEARQEATYFNNYLLDTLRIRRIVHRDNAGGGQKSQTDPRKNNMPPRVGGNGGPMMRGGPRLGGGGGGPRGRPGGPSPGRGGGGGGGATGGRGIVSYGSPLPRGPARF